MASKRTPPSLASVVVGAAFATVGKASAVIPTMKFLLVPMDFILSSFSNFSDELIATLSGLHESKEEPRLFFTFTLKA